MLDPDHHLIYTHGTNSPRPGNSSGGCPDTPRWDAESADMRSTLDGPHGPLSEQVGLRQHYSRSTSYMPGYTLQGNLKGLLEINVIQSSMLSVPD
jgi:hypothetical protein